ncbi:MAG: pyridoxal phosphate-dependent aminotransferase family protein [Verrucomicrobia bacterium]|nr:pyridoxal phosphate-dependent aminotransferase family protein [Verrucomicrobiota bacterium]
MEIIVPLDGPYVQYRGKKVLDFASHDFLGLAHHPEVKKSAIRYTLKFGTGLPSSPLFLESQAQLEEKLAHLLGIPHASFYPSAEVARSIIPEKTTWIDALGKNIAPKGSVCIDESWTFGVLGERGLGRSAKQKGYDFIFASMTQGGGCSASFVASTQPLPKMPISASMLGALDAILLTLPDMDQERELIFKHASWLSKEFVSQGLKPHPSLLPMINLRFKNPEDAHTLWKMFLDADILLGRPSEKELSLTINAQHTPDDLDQLGTTLRRFSTADLAAVMQSLTPTP